MTSSTRLGLVRRSPDFGLLFLAAAGSAFGTYLAAIALTVQIYDETGSGVWVAALLIADFAPIVVIGLLFGPLVDRLSRRWLMVVSDFVRVGLFVVLMFVDDPVTIVFVAGLIGIATGFFRPAALAGLPNLVPDDELANANSLIMVVETLAWMVGPVIGGLMLTVWSPDVPYAVNAATFLVSGLLILRIAEAKLRSEESLTAGHWRDVADGLKLVVSTAPLRLVLVAWSVVMAGLAAVNVAEVVFAKDTLGAGDIGYGLLLGASGLGLLIGTYIAPQSMGKVGLRRHYVWALVLMGAGWGAASLASSIYVAVAFVIAATIGNGAAVVANALFVQRGTADRYRGRALATVMSVHYGFLGIGMVVAGVLTDAYGARAVWMGASLSFFVAAAVAGLMTRWLVGVRSDRVLETYAASAAAALEHGGLEHGGNGAMLPVPVVSDERPAATPGLERIASLLEEIEARRELETRRSTP